MNLSVALSHNRGMVGSQLEQLAPRKGPLLEAQVQERGDGS